MTSEELGGSFKDSEMFQQTQIVKELIGMPNIQKSDPLSMDEPGSQYYSFVSKNADELVLNEAPIMRETVSQNILESFRNSQRGTSQQKCQQLGELNQSIAPQEVELQPVSNEIRKACQQILESLVDKIQLDLARRQKQTKLAPVYSEFCQAYHNLERNVDIEESISNYSQILIKYWREEMFFQHFIENGFVPMLMGKLHELKYAHEIVKSVFGCLEYLVKALGCENISGQDDREEQFIYLLVIINKVGLITEGYRFSDSEDWAYYVHFMKLLVRIINQADRGSIAPVQTQFKQLPADTCSSLEKQARCQQQQQKYSKYLSIFFNRSASTFPLLLKLLYFYKWPDSIIQTSVKLCLLQISNHPNRKLQKYFLNFPFITFYVLYCCKLSDSIQKYLVLCGLRGAHQKESEKEEMLVEEIVSDLKFMEDYLRVDESSPKHHDRFSKTSSLDKCMSMYINAFMYYVGRGFYQGFSKYASQENNNGLINGMLLLIKILKVNTFLKIKLGFQEMIHKYINCRFWAYLKAKRERLDTDKWWMFDQCDAIIKEHTESILYNHQNQSQSESLSLKGARFSSQTSQLLSSSKPVSQPEQDKKQLSYSSLMFKAVKAYIPSTNSNWLSNQIKKMSQVFGLEIALNKQIQHSGNEKFSMYRDSFLYIMEQIQQYNYHGNNDMVLKRKTSLLSRSESPIKPNPLLMSVLNLASKGVRHTGSGKKKGDTNYEDNSEELLYYYLVLVCSIIDDDVYNQMQAVKKGKTNSINLEQIYQLLKIVKNCKSLMLVGLMYWYIRLLDYQLHQANMDFSMPAESSSQGILTGKGDQGKQTLAAELLESYLCTMSKLVYYILTEGWDTFIKHLKQIKKVIWSKRNLSTACSYDDCNKNILTRFTSDIFRDIDCDIVYFVMLRHIFGTRNLDSEVTLCSDEQFNGVISKEIKIPCQLANSGDIQAFLILDGQHMKFLTAEDILITKKPLSVSNFNLYEQEVEVERQQNQDHGKYIKSEIKQKKSRQAMLELVDKNINGECFTVYFQELALREYAAREIKSRKKMTADLEMNLRTMKFEIQD